MGSDIAPAVWKLYPIGDKVFRRSIQMERSESCHMKSGLVKSHLTCIGGGTSPIYPCQKGCRGWRYGPGDMRRRGSIYR